MSNATSGSGRVVALSTSNNGYPKSAVVSDPVRPAQASPHESIASRRSALAEPITVAKFWRNRRGEAVVVRLKQYEGRPLADVRMFYTDKAGRLQPSTKGLAVKMSKLPELHRAISKAYAEARRLGLLGQPINPTRE
jgi:Transcriptional Coactivator p15 (PC4)